MCANKIALFDCLPEGLFYFIFYTNAQLNKIHSHKYGWLINGKSGIATGSTGNRVTHNEKYYIQI